MNVVRKLLIDFAPSRDKLSKGPLNHSKASELQRDLSLKVNEDDECFVESTFRRFEELLQTLQGLGEVCEEKRGVKR